MYSLLPNPSLHHDSIWHHIFPLSLAHQFHAALYQNLIFILYLHPVMYSGYFVDGKLLVEIFLIHKNNKSKIWKKQSHEMFKNIRFLKYFYIGLNNLFSIYFYNTSFMCLCKTCRQIFFFSFIDNFLKMNHSRSHYEGREKIALKIVINLE